MIPDYCTRRKIEIDYYCEKLQSWIPKDTVVALLGAVIDDSTYSGVSAKVIIEEGDTPYFYIDVSILKLC